MASSFSISLPHSIWCGTTPTGSTWLSMFGVSPPRVAVDDRCRGAHQLLEDHHAAFPVVVIGEALLEAGLLSAEPQAARCGRIRFCVRR
jgi:hypothetical protein